MLSARAGSKQLAKGGTNGTPTVEWRPSDEQKMPGTSVHSGGPPDALWSQSGNRPLSAACGPPDARCSKLDMHDVVSRLRR